MATGSACSGRRHQSLGIAILEPELRAPQDAETRAGLEAVKLVWPIRRQYPPPPRQRIVTPHFWLATVVECSIGEGTRHQAEFRIVDDENGEAVCEPILPEPWDFSPDRRGKRFRFSAVSRIRVAIPRMSDLSIQLFIDGAELGETPVYVNTPSSGPLLQFGLGGNSPNIH